MKRIETLEQIIKSGLAEKEDTGAVCSVLNEGRVLARLWREYLNLTQEEAAEKIGMHPGLLSLLETFRATLRPVTIERLAVVFARSQENIDDKISNR